MTNVKLTQKELAYRWGVTVRSVRDTVREFALVPSSFIGLQPVFKLVDVEAMEGRRHAKRLVQLGYKAAA